MVSTRSRENSEDTEQASDKEEKDTAMVAVQVPLDFKAALEEKAKAGNVTVARYIRNLVSAEIGFDLTAFEAKTRTRASKFSSDEEREAAKKANAKKRADVLKALMAKYKAGEIQL